MAQASGLYGMRAVGSPNERIRKRLELYVCVWLVTTAYQTDVPIMMACMCGMCVRRCLQAAYT